MQHLSSLPELAEKYDGFILDLWGVVHDGEKLYRGVRESFAYLRERGKQIIILSNAPRRSHRAAQVLVRLGIDERQYDHLITSGEVMFSYLAQGEHPYGKHYFFIGPDKDLDVLDGLNFSRAGLLQADMLLNVGFERDDQELAEWESTLLTAARLRKPMICANPDLVVVRQSGERLGCAGLIAQAYAGMGGEVLYFGKPFPLVYEACLQRFDGLQKSQICAIGDSLHTDILGANQAGVASCLVLGGILKERLYAQGSLDETVLKEAMLEDGARPEYCLAQFGLLG